MSTKNIYRIYFGEDPDWDDSCYLLYSHFPGMTGWFVDSILDDDGETKPYVQVEFARDEIAEYLKTDNDIFIDCFIKKFGIKVEEKLNV